MAFVQVMEVRTAKVDEMRALEAEWRAATEGRRTLLRSIVAQDRDDAGRVFVLAFFDSYEAAMKNSELPETAALAEKTAALVDGPIVFHNLDVVDEFK